MSHPIAYWVQTEAEQADLQLTHIGGCIWKDKDGQFWFNDECEIDVCGPYSTVEAAQQAAINYSKTL